MSLVAFVSSTDKCRQDAPRVWSEEIGVVSGLLVAITILYNPFDLTRACC